MTSAPAKTDNEIQRDAEAERIKLGYSTRGLGATILTGRGGLLAPPVTSGVTLGA